MPSATDANANPIAALLRRYVQRRGVSTHELGRRIGRTQQAVSLLLTGETTGLKPWNGQRLLFLVAGELEIPERELQRALTAHYRQIGADDLSALATSRNATKRRASSRRQINEPLDLARRKAERELAESLPRAANF